MTDGISRDEDFATTRRRRRERFWVALVFLLILIFGFTEGRLFKLQSDVPVPGGNYIILAVMNINVLLLLLLVYLVLRNIVKLVFERKRNILGHKLRTRLVTAFVLLSLIPTLPLFWVATQFIFSSLDYWFSQKVEQSLEQAVTLARDHLDQKARDLVHDCRLLRIELTRFQGPDGLPAPDRGETPETILERYRMDGVFLSDSQGNVVWKAMDPTLPPVDMRSVHLLLEKEPETSSKIILLGDAGRREALIAHALLPPAGGGSGGTVTEITVLRLIPSQISEKFSSITSGYEDYLQLKLLRVPLKRSHFITFSIVTLLTVFGAVWFGFFLAKNITVPIQALVAATQRIAGGDLDTQIAGESSDEIGMLISSFNKMVLDLKGSRRRLDSAYDALQLSHEELEDRRRYIEIVLRNIAAGVVGVDASGRIMTINPSAEALFGFRAEEVKGRSFADFLQPAQIDTVKTFMESYRMSRPSYIERRAQVIIGNRPMALLIKASILRDDQGEYMGAVVVLDDLTELEKAQRMAAWREVARRIAHEIKNPLTPIKLSAQRLRRKHADLLEAEGSVLDECTDTIIRQVDRMKHLVDEFSRFARLPKANPIPCDLGELVEECLILYRHSRPNITFGMECHDEFPLLRLDRDQFRQVMINLFENAVQAMGDAGGSVTVKLFYDSILKIARLECADTGPGLSPEDRLRMFEPYYSTKEKGTGLGLAIVAGIVADHNGFVRVRDNVPHGAVVIVELPG